MIESSPLLLLRGKAFAVAKIKHTPRDREGEREQCFNVQMNLIIAVKAQVSKPPFSVLATQAALTDLLKIIHKFFPKNLEQKGKSNHQGGFPRATNQCLEFSQLLNNSFVACVHRFLYRKCNKNHGFYI